MKMIIYSSLKTILLIISVLLSVAFVTLVERKTLSFIQARKGPSKSSFYGILQPIMDAVKLFLKQSNSLSLKQYMMFTVSPSINLMNAIIIWICLSSKWSIFKMNLSILFLMLILSLSVFLLFNAGWISNCVFSSLGAIRSVAQSISYEISFFIILLSIVILWQSISLDLFENMKNKNVILTLSIPLMVLWLISALAETNRTPFDFSEGESELVSGFNTEFSGALFAFFFLAEYSSIIFMSLILATFISSYYIHMMLISLALIYIFVWIRASLPRMRFDTLMSAAWKNILPLSMFYFLVIMIM